jgi:hypothetical protein
LFNPAPAEEEKVRGFKLAATLLWIDAECLTEARKVNIDAAISAKAEG